MVDMIFYRDEKYKFNEIFNEKNGLLLRTNILSEEGIETKNKPYMRSFPELMDIGIMGSCHVYKKYCKKFGIECYQVKDCLDMSIELYENIIHQCKGKVFQVALGGKGDPNKHKDFEKILKITRENNIVPNLTTTGINITDEELKLIKKYAGAVAISLYSKLNENLEEDNIECIDSINKMIDNKITTNIHYVINNNTIEDAIKRLKNNKFPKGINAIIFLLYKRKNELINIDKVKISEFFYLINKNTYNFKIGFDTCFSPLIRQFLIKAEKRSIEECEAARFSCYISSKGILYPCSFIQDNKYGIDLKDMSILDAWNSNKMNEFRKLNSEKCRNCTKNNKCFFGCKYNLNQYICNRNIKK